MVRRMAIKGLLIAPAVVLALWVANGAEWALSGAVGLAMTVLNLWLAAKIIGSIAERNPRLLLAGAMVAFTAGLAALSLVAVVLKATDVVYFPVTGITLVAAHLLLVVWEAAPFRSKQSSLHAQST